jgi:hypothetical protein
LGWLPLFLHLQWMITTFATNRRNSFKNSDLYTMFAIRLDTWMTWPHQLCTLLVTKFHYLLMVAIFSHQIVESKEEEFHLHIKAIKNQRKDHHTPCHNHIKSSKWCTINMKNHVSSNQQMCGYQKWNQNPGGYQDSTCLDLTTRCSQNWRTSSDI